VPAGDANALAREITALLEDRELARKFGEHGAQAAKKYDWGVVANRLEQIYDTVRLKADTTYK